jgi:hypothetical protein
MLAACSPVASNIEETLSTLRYADSAKSIKTAAVKNEDPAQAKIRELSNELEALKKRLEEAESGGGGVRKFDSMRSMSPREKESLLAELDSQMSILKDNDGFQAQKRRSRRTSMVFKQEKIKEYPMLSCLSKDNMLSHVMNVAIFHQLPFVIGRTETKSTTNLTDIPTSGPETSHLDDHGSESQDGIDGGVGYKNNFNLDGMGIQSHHCMFEKYIKKPQSNLSNIQEGDEDNEAAVRVSTDKLENLNLNNIGNGGVNKNDNDDDEDCLSIRALSSTSVVCVNGVPINEMDGLPPIKLQHLDRIVLGPCRLICLYLTHELSYKDRNYWNYDACFTELSSRGKEIPRSLLSTSRCKLVDQLSQLECEEIAQCNAIACEMGCNVRFACDLVVQGGQGLSKPNYLMDEFLDSNQTKIVINVFVDTELPKIKTAKDLLIAMKRPKKHEGSVGPLVPPTPNTAIVQGRLLDTLRDNPFDSYNIEQLKNSGEHHLLHDGNTNNNENGGGGGEDDESLLFDPLGKDSKLVSLCTLEIDDFQDIFIHLKATHASLSRLTGGLSDAMDTSESLLSSAPPSPLSTSPPSSSSSSSSHKIGLFQTVFNKLDIDHSGKIDHHELQQALKEFNNHTTKDNENNESDTHHGHHHNHQYDHDFIDQICIEERLSDDTELTYDEFEMFLISFLQHQFYRCIEHVVTNRTLFIDIGGRDITTLLAMQDHELVMKHRLASLTHMVASRNHHHHSDHHHSEDERRLSRKSVNKEKDTKDGSGGGGGGASDSHKPKRIPKPHPHRKSSSLSGPNSVVKFLQECNLNHHSKTLIQLGVDNVKDLFDSKLLTDEDLLESAHFTLEEITIFRNMIASYKLQPISEMLIGAGLEDEMLSFVNAGIGCLPDASPEELEKSAQQGILLTKLFNAMKGNETYV